MEERREPTASELLMAIRELGANQDGTNAQLTAVRVEVMARLDRLQETVTAIRDDISVNYGRADKAEMVAQHAREEVRALSEIVSGMGRQIQRLQTVIEELRDRG